MHKGRIHTLIQGKQKKQGGHESKGSESILLCVKKKPSKKKIQMVDQPDDFISACKKAEVESTKRQLSKFRNGHGAAKGKRG